MEKNAMQRLNNLILEKNSRICAGLEPTWQNIPNTLKIEIINNEHIDLDAEETCNIYLEEVLKEYCNRYIQAIKDVVPAIQINSAFFEQKGLQKLYFEVASKAKEAGLFVIGDVKRGDIGAAAEAYAQAYLKEGSPFDVITINPYFGTEGVRTFLKLAKENGKGVFILLTSFNQILEEIQRLKCQNMGYINEIIADLIIKWMQEFDRESFGCGINRPEKYSMIGVVTGLTSIGRVLDLIERMGKTFFIIPDYSRYERKPDEIAYHFDSNGCGAIINFSIEIMNAYKDEYWKNNHSEEEWEEAAKEAAIRLTEKINEVINKKRKNIKI